MVAALLLNAARPFPSSQARTAASFCGYARQKASATACVHATWFSAVAKRAGVERLTVYRHFPDDAAMLTVRSHRYFELNPSPDPSA